MHVRAHHVLLVVVAVLLSITLAEGTLIRPARAQRSGATRLSEAWSAPIEMLGHKRRSDENLTEFNKLVADKLADGWTLVSIVSNGGGPWDGFESHTLTAFFTR